MSVTELRRGKPVFTISANSQLVGQRQLVGQSRAPGGRAEPMPAAPRHPGYTRTTDWPGTVVPLVQQKFTDTGLCPRVNWNDFALVVADEADFATVRLPPALYQPWTPGLPRVAAQRRGRSGREHLQILNVQI